MILVGKCSCVLLLLATLVIYNHFLLKLDFNDSHCLRSKAPLFYYWKHAKRIYCLFEINAFLEVNSVFKSTGLPECPRFWRGQNNSEGFFDVTGCDKIWWRPVPTAPYVPVALKVP